MSLDTTGYTDFRIALGAGDVETPQALEVLVDPAMNSGANILCFYSGILRFAATGTSPDHWDHGSLLARLPTAGRTGVLQVFTVVPDGPYSAAGLRHCRWGASTTPASPTTQVGPSTRLNSKQCPARPNLGTWKIIFRSRRFWPSGTTTAFSIASLTRSSSSATTFLREVPGRDGGLERPPPRRLTRARIVFKRRT